VPGFNFALAAIARHVERLTALCHSAGLVCVPVPPLNLADWQCRASRIRAELLRGEVALAAELLGRPHRVRASSWKACAAAGRSAFRRPIWSRWDRSAPGNGVYAVAAWMGDSGYAGAANVGRIDFWRTGAQNRGASDNFTGDLYGKQLAVDFVARLRETRPFAGPQELVEQLRADVTTVRRLLG